MNPERGCFFFGNKSSEDLVYREQLDNLEQNIW